MTQNEKLAELSEAGVAVWLDHLSRDRHPQRQPAVAGR
jgi:transaldolase